MLNERASGVLLHISSLPSKYGIGCFDKCAYDFVDFLQAAGQTYWQILPLCPTTIATRLIRVFPPLRLTSILLI